MSLRKAHAVHVKKTTEALKCEIAEKPVSAARHRQSAASFMRLAKEYAADGRIADAERCLGYAEFAADFARSREILENENE
jgi:hypothetical protein